MSDEIKLANLRKKHLAGAGKMVKEVVAYYYHSLDIVKVFKVEMLPYFTQEEFSVLKSQFDNQTYSYPFTRKNIPPIEEGNWLNLWQLQDSNGAKYAFLFDLSPGSELARGEPIYWLQEISYDLIPEEQSEKIYVFEVRKNTLWARFWRWLNRLAYFGPYDYSALKEAEKKEAAFLNRQCSEKNAHLPKKDGSEQK